MTKRITAWLTGESVTPESAAHGDWAEHGWVDPQWSLRVFHDSRNDVRPLLDMAEDDPDLAESVRDVLSEYLGSYADNGDGTFYGQDSSEDYQTGTSYTYAVHFVAKYRDASAPDAEPYAGYVERSWHPADNGVTLAGE